MLEETDSIDYVMEKASGPHFLGLRLDGLLTSSSPRSSPPSSASLFRSSSDLKQPFVIVLFALNLQLCPGDRCVWWNGVGEYYGLRYDNPATPRPSHRSSQPGVIEVLINSGRHIDVVNLVFAFELTEQFSPVPLLKAYLKDARKTTPLKPINTSPNTSQLFSGRMVSMACSFFLVMDPNCLSGMVVQAPNGHYDGDSIFDQARHRAMERPADLWLALWLEADSSFKGSLLLNEIF